MNHDVVVIGAGVSGLSCAQDLMARGLDVKVLERQVTTGGNAKSSTFDGFLMEHGPTTMNAAFPNAMARISALGLDAAARPLGPNVRKRYLRDENGLHGISAHPMGFFTSGYLSPIERASMLAEFLRPRKSGGTDETIHQFAARRFGKGFADKVIEPMAAGIFMGDSKTLSISGAFPKLVELEQRHGSIIRGILAAKRGSEPGRNLLSWDGGIGTLPQTQTRLLGPRIETGVTVTKITRNPAGFVVATANSGTVTARALVLAVQPHVAAALLEPLDPITAKAAAEISAPPISVVYLGYRPERVTPLGIRDYAILVMLYATGVRVSELCGVSLSGVDRQRFVVRVLGKGNKERLVPRWPGDESRAGRLAASAPHPGVEEPALHRSRVRQRTRRPDLEGRRMEDRAQTSAPGRHQP